MQTLSLSLKAKQREGAPLPPVFPQLEAIGAKIRQGQVTLVAGPPGAGKTALMSHWAVNVDYTGAGDYVPGMYFSMDSDRGTVGTRVVSNITGLQISDAERALQTSEDLALWEKLQQRTAHIHWVWDASPSGQDILDEVECYGYVHGSYPDWIIFDNLMDMAGEDAVALNSAMDFGKVLAREKGPAVIFLHHVTGEYEDGLKPIPLSGLRYKLGKIPRLVLTLHRPDPLLIGVSVVKNSNGRMDPSGNYGTQIPVIMERMWFGGTNSED